MKTATDTDLVQRSLSAHSALGLICCALLYLICVSGTAVVLYEEWQRLEQTNAPEMGTIEHASVQRAVENVLRTEKGSSPTTHLYVHLPVPSLPRTTVTTDTQAFHVDRNGSIVTPEQNAWSEFLLALHYRLNLPATIGMTLVGAFGAMIVALSISGVLAHPRIFRDAFRLRARRNDDVSTVDWHNRLAIWTLPFALAIALTGSVIGLFYVTAGGLASAAYEGDSEAAIAPIFGDEPAENANAAPPAKLVPALEYMEREFPEVRPSYIILHDPGTVGQHLQIVGLHSQRLIFGEYYAFDSAGRFQGTAGLADGEIGQQLAASVYNLHFGNFGGLIVKIAYIAFGLALSIVVATGTFIWLNKRERRGLPSTKLRAGWWGLVIGVPAGLVTTLGARLIIGNEAAFVAIYWATCLLVGSGFLAANASAMGSRS